MGGKTVVCLARVDGDALTSAPAGATHIVGCDLPHDGRTLRIAQVAAAADGAALWVFDTSKWESAAGALDQCERFISSVR